MTIRNASRVVLLTTLGAGVLIACMDDSTNNPIASGGNFAAFKLSGRGGKTIDLSQFKGQVVMINF